MPVCVKIQLKGGLPFLGGKKKWNQGINLFEDLERFIAWNNLYNVAQDIKDIYFKF